jgi:hypothetical protein
MHPMALQRTGCGARALPITCLLLAVLLTSCSVRDKAEYGIVNAGKVPPLDGARAAEIFYRDVSNARKALPLPPLARQPELDVLATTGLQHITAGLPEGVAAVIHIDTAAPLPEELQYFVGFEESMPGLSEALLEQGRRRTGESISEAALAADPAFVAVGWAADGPWSVFVARARALTPADGPALQAALEMVVREQRPALATNADLARIAGDALADNLVDSGDVDHLKRAGGVPVKLSFEDDELEFHSNLLRNTLGDEGPGTLREAWLTSVGVAAKVTEAGKVLFIVVATGEVDHAVLAAEIAATESKAPDLVNKARAEAALPPVSWDPALAVLARQWVAEASRRGCYVGFDDQPDCPGTLPQAAESVYASRRIWSRTEGAFTWYLAPAQHGDDQMKRFGAAAAIAADGVLWCVIMFGP